MEEPQVLSVKCPHCSNRLKLTFRSSKRPERLTCTVCKQTSPFSSFAVLNNTPAAPVKSNASETDLLVGGAHKHVVPTSAGETDLLIGGGARVAAAAGLSNETSLVMDGMRPPMSCGDGVANNPSSRPSCGRLVFLSGGMPPAQLFEGRNIVGREASTSPATIRLPRQYQRISRGHLIINVRAVGNGYRHEVQLFKSDVNTTMINSRPISGDDVFILNNGDTIMLPDVVMRFEI